MYCEGLKGRSVAELGLGFVGIDGLTGVGFCAGFATVDADDADNDAGGRVSLDLIPGFGSTRVSGLFEAGGLIGLSTGLADDDVDVDADVDAGASVNLDLTPGLSSAFIISGLEGVKVLSLFGKLGADGRLIGFWFDGIVLGCLLSS